MRDHHFQGFLAVVLTFQAATVSAAVNLTTGIAASTSNQLDHVKLVEPIDVNSTSMFDTQPSGSSQFISSHTRSATADVMNLPAEPIPTPPAFAMGMTVIVGLLGYKTVRRLRFAA